MAMSVTKPGEIPVSVMASGHIRRVRRDANIAEVAAALVKADTGMLVIGDRADDVAGVVSERDIVRAIAAGRDITSTSALAIGNTSLVWCDAHATVADVAMKMMQSYVRHALLEDRGRLVGIVSMRDLLGAYAAPSDSEGDSD